jgi:periplasmic mercuric ion binding protein
MTPLHPLLVHYPIVLLVVAAGFYIAGMALRKPLLDVIGFVFHALGLAACIVVIFTGDYEADRIATDPALKAMIQRHESLVTYATYGFGMLGIWAFLRQKSQVMLEKVGFIVLFVGLNVLIGIGAHVGGEMVYLHVRFFVLLLPFLVLASVWSGCSNKGNASTEFWVRGNCEMCKATIEGALAATPGVASAVYDLDAHTLHVDYDSTKVTISGLHAACAGAGYESKVQSAEPQAYANLPTCCKKPEDQ